jgi:hypothetical protein
MNLKAFFLAMAISTGFLVLTITSIRKRRLRDQTAVLWLGVSIVMVVFSLGLPFSLLDRMSHAVGVAYGSDLLLLLAVVFLVVLVFNLSVNLAVLKEKQTVLVQEIALMQAEAPGDADDGHDGASNPLSQGHLAVDDQGDLESLP